MAARILAPALALALALALATAGVARAETLGERLGAYYGTRRGYREVKADVLRWHKTTHNGCVAFASSALRRVGVDIGETTKVDGEGVSRITRAFVVFLETQLAWQRITDPHELRAGDLVFTTDAPCCPGYPAHVVMFVRWRDPRRLVARVVDNQGFGTSRPLRPGAGTDVDPFAFALRAP